MTDRLLKELKEISKLFLNANSRLNRIIYNDILYNDIVDHRRKEMLLKDENISRIQILLSDKEDIKGIKEIKEIVNKTYDKIKEYLMQSALPNDYYTINDIYLEYYYFLSSGLKAREINKIFYQEITKKYKDMIRTENYKRQVYNNTQ